MFTKESTERAAKDFKIAFNEAIFFAEEKQETLAMRIGVTQGQVNNWCNVNSDRNFPMALLPVLPVRMQHYLMDHINKQCDTVKTIGSLNGSVDDEIISLIMMESDLKKQSESDSRKAKQTIMKMREILNRAEMEVEGMREAKK
jgi:hypothetical protein